METQPFLFTLGFALCNSRIAIVQITWKDKAGKEMQVYTLAEAVSHGIIPAKMVTAANTARQQLVRHMMYADDI